MGKPADDHDHKVNPQHYASLGGYSAVHIIRAWNRFRAGIGLAPIDFNVGNALKYMQRAGLKPGEDEIVDLKKAVWYLKNRIFELDPTQEDPAA